MYHLNDKASGVYFYQRERCFYIHTCKFIAHCGQMFVHVGAISSLLGELFIFLSNVIHISLFFKVMH